jgi:hypothetical protein
MKQSGNEITEIEFKNDSFFITNVNILGIVVMIYFLLVLFN